MNPNYDLETTFTLYLRWIFMDFMQNEIKMEDICWNVDVFCGFDEISPIKSKKIDAFSISGSGHFIANNTSTMVFRSEFQLP